MHKILSRDDLSKIPEYKEILDAEQHHNAVIIEVDGMPRWESNPIITKMVDAIGLNEVVAGLLHNNHDKNSEIYREIYRGIGYSLSGYWEIFYWEANNEDAAEYRAGEEVQ